MIYLDSITKKLQIVLDGAISTSQLEITAHFFDHVPAATTTIRRGGTQISSTNNTTDVDIVSAPVLQGIIRNIHTISIYNKDTIQHDVTVKIDNSGTETILVKQTISAGDSITYEDQSGWTVFQPLNVPGDVTASIQFSGDVSPAQITANQNNYEPTDLDIAAVLRINSDARRNITGLAQGADGRVIWIFNVGTFPIVFTWEDTNSTAANRFAFGVTLGGAQGMEIMYDSTSSRWRAQSLPEPLGTIKDFGGGTVPAGFLACDGSTVSRTTYAPLFNEIGTTWNTGGEAGTDFRLPNFQRRVAVGSGGSGTGTLANTVGSTGGAETHTISTAELPAHDHGSAGSHTHSVQVGTVDDVFNVADGTTHQAGGDPGGFGSVTSTGTALSDGAHTHSSVGSGTAHNILQPSAVVTKIIKYV